MKNKILSWLFSGNFWHFLDKLFFLLIALEAIVAKCFFDKEPSNFNILMVLLVSIAMNEDRKTNK
jgi:hypothetical protein